MHRRFDRIDLDKAGLGHNTVTEEAVALIVRSADGIVRRARNLCLSCLLEAVRARVKTIGIEIVNKVLIQPHWRNEYDLTALKNPVVNDTLEKTCIGTTYFNHKTSIKEH